MIQPNAQVCRRLAGASLECAAPHPLAPPRLASLRFARLVEPPHHAASLQPPLSTLAGAHPAPRPSARRPTTHRFTTTSRDAHDRETANCQRWRRHSREQRQFVRSRSTGERERERERESFDEPELGGKVNTFRLASRRVESFVASCDVIPFFKLLTTSRWQPTRGP